MSKTEFTQCKLSFGRAKKNWDRRNTYVNHFWSDTKKYGPAQTMYGPVEGQGISQFGSKLESKIKII